ncbi:thioredoxin family protein [Paenibacillus contaminans]|uniref:Thioredoxin n=1 Tax=Paenibacillus contaminans TaxID=450362 RepID=A0A329MBP3_9BACL|nr:thioredoxin family protein [Paenibacillus contaminans]RAV16033.1 thiol reductase thioredoxin [Paenibacillus contaminans]
MSLIHVNDDNFASMVQKGGVTMAEFGAPWCPPCKVLLPILEELSAELGDSVPILTVDVDESPVSAGRFGVMAMPTVIVFHDGEPVEKLVGLRSKAAYAAVLAKAAALSPESPAAAR